MPLHTKVWAFSWAVTDLNNKCLTASFLGQPGKADTRKVKPIWIIMKQEMMG